MAVMNTIKILQVNVQHWTTNKINFYNKIRVEDPDIVILNEHGVRNNGKIKIYGYKTELKNISNQARDGAAIAIKWKINHRKNNNLSKNIVAYKIQSELGPIIIATVYIPQRRPIIPRADFDFLKTHNCLVYVLEDVNGNLRQSSDRQNNNTGD